jgi:hypothetical protein
MKTSYGYCECGCGEKTTVASVTCRHWGWTKGEPKRYVKGHATRGRKLPTRTSDPPPNPSGLCQCGCGGTTPVAPHSDRTKGWVIGEHKRFINGHNGRGKRFFSLDAHVEEDHGYETPCWISLRSPTSVRPFVRWEGRDVLLYRVVYERDRGEIPEGWHVHHLCEQGRCINPTHLEALSPTDHMALHFSRAA